MAIRKGAAAGAAVYLPGPAGGPGPACALTIGAVTSGASPAATLTGDPPNQVLGLVLPKGDTGAAGQSAYQAWLAAGNVGTIGAFLAALVGPAGPACALAIGTVTTGVPGSAAAAVITGSAPNQTLSLTIPRGDTGAAGPANSLAIGAVVTGAAGSSAAATVTGAAPSQTLNLTLPKGDTGATGPANSLAIGTVATGAAGSSAAATVTGSAPSQTLNLTIPKGDAGVAGPANSLAIGTVSTGAAGSSAAATITGSAPSQTLNLTIPRGADGAPSAGALAAANNLSDVANAGLAWANLHLAPAFPSASASLLAAAAGQDQYATGTITLTMPNGGAKWRSGIVTNANTLSGFVALAVPSGATLDGVTDGTTKLRPYQRARILQTGATAYVTDWVERRPLLVSSTLPADAASASWLLPAGYAYDFRVDNARVSASAASLFARLAYDAAGTSFRSGANDYNGLQEYGSTTQSSGAAVTMYPGTGAAATYILLAYGMSNNAASAAQVKGDIGPGSASIYPIVNAEATYIEPSGVTKTGNGYVCPLGVPTGFLLGASSGNLLAGTALTITGRPV